MKRYGISVCLRHPSSHTSIAVTSRATSFANSHAPSVSLTLVLGPCPASRSSSFFYLSLPFFFFFPRFLSRSIIITPPPTPLTSRPSPAHHHHNQHHHHVLISWSPLSRLLQSRHGRLLSVCRRRCQLKKIAGSLSATESTNVPPRLAA